jgi:hypothetical protein
LWQPAQALWIKNPTRIKRRGIEMPAGKSYAPRPPAKNNAFLIVARSGCGLVTVNREALDDGTPKGSVVSRRIVRCQPADKDATFTKDGGVIQTGTSEAE